VACVLLLLLSLQIKNENVMQTDDIIGRVVVPLHNVSRDGFMKGSKVCAHARSTHVHTRNSYHVLQVHVFA
jgi:hypothetical protein